MLSMESFAGGRVLGEESLQMWDLNKRLEAYLARVKFLEEENEVLRAEIQSAKSSPAGDSWRAKYEEELRALRDALDDAFREKCTAELARDNLYEEVQQVKSRCQKEQAAREEAKKLLSLSKKELEEERRAQIWLKERAVQLEKEVETLLEVHEEEKAGLDQEIASFSQSLESFRCAPVAFQPVEVEDYSKKLSEIWKGAVETYKTEVSQLEGSLCQAKENLWKAVEDNQQSQLRLQHLEKDLVGLKVRKEMLEENLARQWQEQRGEAEKFQLAMEALEQEKQTLRAQIAQVLEDRQQLMHLKMSLSLEVATYRTLLEAESTRLQMPPGEHKVPNGLRDLKLEGSGGRKLAAARGDARRLLPRDHRASSSVVPGVKSQRDVLSPPNPSPGTRELQQISSVLHAKAPRAAGVVQEVIVLGCSTPGTSKPSKAPSLYLEPVPPEPGSPGGEGPAWPGGDGDEVVQGMEHPPLREVMESHDANIGLPGGAPIHSLRYPAQLVSEALEDALKEMKDDVQPKEEPTTSAEWVLQDALAPSPIPPIEASGGDGEGQEEPSEAAKDEAPQVEERVGEAVLQELGMESSARWDGAAAPPGPHPYGTAASQEEVGAWEEEMPSTLSPREAEVMSQDEDTACPGQVETGWEELEQGDDEVDAPSVEDLHPLEDEEEERGTHSPCGEEGDFHHEGMDGQARGSPPREDEAACAVPVESHLALPTKSHLEEDLVDGEEEKSEHWEMSLCEMELSAEEERGQETCPGHETCPGQEPSSIHEAIPAEEASSGAEEDTVGEKDPGRAGDGEGEKGEASGEVLGGEDSWAREAVGPEILGQESRAWEEQENGFVEKVLEEELEPELGEEPWGGNGDGNSQKPCPEDWEVTAEDTEGALGTEESTWVDDAPTSARGLENEEGGDVLPSGTQGDDEDARGQGMDQQESSPEAEPARDEQEGTTEKPTWAPRDGPAPGDNQEADDGAEESWEMQDEDGDDEVTSELGQLESGSTGPAELRVGDRRVEEDGERWGELEQERVPSRRVELEDTLPDSTPLGLYQGDVVAGVTPSLDSMEMEEITETTSGAKIAPEEAEETTEKDPEETTEKDPESEEVLEEIEETTETISESKISLEETEETMETTPEPKIAPEEAEEIMEKDPESKVALEEIEETMETILESKVVLEETEETTETTSESKITLEETEETMETTPESKTAPEEAEENVEKDPESKVVLEETEETMEKDPESEIPPEEAEETMETTPESKTAPEEAEENVEKDPESKISLEETEETTETTPKSEISPEDEGWLEGCDKPPAPTMPESQEEEEVTTAAESAEEEEGYFMVSAPSQEMSEEEEEAEISEDFEEIKVEETKGSKDDLEASGEASPVPEDEGHFEAFVGEADEEVKVPTEDPEMPKGEDDAESFTAELEEGPDVPKADPGALGPPEGDVEEPIQVAMGFGAHEGPGCPEGLDTKLVEDLQDEVELEVSAGRAEAFPGVDMGLVGQEEEEEEEEEKKKEEEEEEEEEKEEEDEPSMAHHDMAKLIPPGALQAQEMLVSPLPNQAEQTPDECVEEEPPDGDNPHLAGYEETLEVVPPQLEQEGSPEVVSESPEVEVADLSAKVDIMKDSDILEIVEQALEFNQEVVMGVRAAEGGHWGPSGTELPRDTGEDSSPTSSSEEEPTVQEAPGDVAPGPVRAENGLHRQASLEDLTEEVLNGIANVPPAQEFPLNLMETTEPTTVMPPQPSFPGDATITKLDGATTTTLVDSTTTTKLVDSTTKLDDSTTTTTTKPDDAPTTSLADAPLLGKHGGADTIPMPPSLEDDILCLVANQPPACRLRAEQEPWSSGDE